MDNRRGAPIVHLVNPGLPPVIHIAVESPFCPSSLALVPAERNPASGQARTGGRRIGTPRAFLRPTAEPHSAKAYARVVLRSAMPGSLDVRAIGERDRAKFVLREYQWLNLRHGPHA